jgi:cell division septation protein DedD
MASSSQDTEITLGTTKLLFLFFGLVAVCALFFSLGYSLGRKAEPGITTASAAASPQITPGGSKPAGAGSAPPMTFYKAVEQKDANGELTPAANDPKSVSKADAPAHAPSAAEQSASAAANAPDPTTTLPSGGYSVQVAAVSKQEDAESLVDALKKKQYPASASTSSTDKFFHIQVGPFSDIKDAEAMRARLISDGYNPILKK